MDDWIMIVIALIVAMFVFYFGLQAYSELYWRLEKYGKRARVPYVMKRHYVMNIRKNRQKHAKEREIILKRLFSSM